MLTNILLTVGLLVALMGPPDVSKMPILSQGSYLCENGIIFEITNYDSDPNDKDASIRILESGGLPVAAIDFKKKEVYIYKEKKSYTIEEAQVKYPNPCDIPAGQGV